MTWTCQACPIHIHIHPHHTTHSLATSHVSFPLLYSTLTTYNHQISQHQKSDRIKIHKTFQVNWPLDHLTFGAGPCWRPLALALTRYFSHGENRGETKGCWEGCDNHPCFSGKHTSLLTIAIFCRKNNLYIYIYLCVFM